MHRLIFSTLAVALAVPAAAQTDGIARLGDNRGAIEISDSTSPDGTRFDLYLVTGSPRSIRIPDDAAAIPLDIAILDGSRNVLQNIRWTPGDGALDLAGDGDRFYVEIAATSPGLLGAYHFVVSDEELAVPPPPPPPPPPPEPVYEGQSVATLKSVPKASRSATVQLPCLSNGSVNYGQLFERIRTILDRRGYSRSDQGWFLVPDGIAITTKFERIADNGRPIVTDRFNAGPFYNGFWQIVSSDIQPGRYRSTMVIYGKGVRQEDSAASFAGAIDLTNTGDLPLPPGIAARRSAAGNYIQMLVYEYARPSLGAPAALVKNGLLASNHLKASGLGPAINNVCRMTP